MTTSQLFLRSSKDSESNISQDESEICIIGSQIGERFGKKYRVKFGSELGRQIAQAIYDQIKNTHSSSSSSSLFYCSQGTVTIPVIKKSKKSPQRSSGSSHDTESSVDSDYSEESGDEVEKISILPEEPPIACQRTKIHRGY